jgi:murein DD-endopeptidase MepM/ murein hydrolase activator NlpD
MSFKRPASGRGQRIKVWLLAALGLVIILYGIWYLFGRLEGENPIIVLKDLPAVFPADSEISGTISDLKTGVKKIRIELIKDDKEMILFEKEYPPSDFSGSGGYHQIPLAIDLNTKQLGISDGKAKILLTVWDHSWRNWWNGNKTDVEKDIVFDTKPPIINVLSGQHYINRGGAGLLIYQLSEPCDISGVKAGEEFFPGHAGYFENKNIYMAFFAVRSDQDMNTQLYVTAVDAAGNSSKSGFNYHILNKTFKKDTIEVSDAFLNSKFPEFQSSDGWPQDDSTIDKFIFINQTLRAKDNTMILSNGKHTDANIYWEGAFLRLPNSAPMAGYADHRSYSYHGNVIDEADHMGIDLASLANAEVPAANGGKIVFVGDVGIYGNLICIDHGFGLFSIYAHLSQVNVSSGDMVSKGDIIGRTGNTGWAGGDHLHYGMFVDHVFVNPVEWWDSTWIKNNITDKIKGVSGIKK